MRDAEFGTTLPPIEIAGDGVLLRSFAYSDLFLVEEASHDVMIPLITTVPSVWTLAAG